MTDAEVQFIKVINKGDGFNIRSSVHCDQTGADTGEGQETWEGGADQWDMDKHPEFHAGDSIYPRVIAVDGPNNNPPFASSTHCVYRPGNGVCGTYVVRGGIATLKVNWVGTEGPGS